MMVISQFSLVGIILFVVVVIAGTILKLVLRKKRKELEGFHGYMEKENHEQDEGITDDWESL